MGSISKWIEYVGYFIVEIIQREEREKRKKNLIASNKQSIYILKREISRGISFKIGSFWIRYQVQYAFVRQTSIKLHRSHQFTEGMSMGLLDSISSNVIRYRGRNVVSTRWNFFLFRERIRRSVWRQLKLKKYIYIQGRERGMKRNGERKSSGKWEFRERWGATLDIRRFRWIIEKLEVEFKRRWEYFLCLWSPNYQQDCFDLGNFPTSCIRVLFN